MLSTMIKNKHNQLIHETSPYLLQHAKNPVNWYAWNETSLEIARSEDKPIFLSIGYSACHWCHVMAHESFEDTTTAEIMNQYFINIKVDKEERPDIDKIYQVSQQILTQKSGGWPLSMFLTPKEHIPFFGGTYFPMEAKYNLPSFKDILIAISEFYQQKKDSINKQNQTFLDVFKTINQPKIKDKEIKLTLEPLAKATQQLEQNFDSKFGGFGIAPKFPHPSNLEYLLRQYLRTNCKQMNTINMVNITLHKMALGGLYDQLAGGFFRYSVDEKWTIPHFEKMLYDNALLLTLYNQAYAVTNIPLYQHIATSTAEWIINNMQSSEGGYYSSLDADSEGQEGEFYIWHKDEIARILDTYEYTAFANYYGLNQPANFEGKWHLQVTALTNDEKQIRLLNQAKEKLLRHREKRMPPFCDDKILTSWNALMIKGMITTTITFNDNQYAISAEKALLFIYQNMYQNGRLFATYRNNKTHLNAYLDDYAFLIDSILTFLQYRWQQKWLDMAIQLTEQLLKLFFHEQQGGFFFTAHDHEKLIHRGKYFMDDALPSGNGVAAYVLCKLFHLTGEIRYANASESVLKTAWTSIMQQPSAYSSLLYALEENMNATKNAIIFSDTSDHTWQQIFREKLTPFDSVMMLPADNSALPGLLSKYNTDQLPVAYLCDGHTCHKPILDILDINSIPPTNLEQTADISDNDSELSRR